MSKLILYCEIIHIKHKKIIAESTKGSKFNLEVKSLYNEIFSKISKDQISIDDKNFISYQKIKDFAFVVVSKKTSKKDEAFIFIKELIKNIEINIKPIKKLVEDFSEIFYNTQEEKLRKIIDEIISLFNSDDPEKQIIAVIQKDVEEVKDKMKNNIEKQIENIETLEDPLIKAENIKNQANLFRRNTKKELKRSEGFCVKFKKIWLILLGIFAVLIILYVSISLIRCKSLNLFCDTS